MNRENHLLNGDTIEHLYTYRNFPVFMGCSTSSRETDICQDLNIGVGKSSGLIQIINPAPIDQVYIRPHGSGTIGESWNKHHYEFSKFISEINPSNILEIGSHHTILYNNCKKWKKDLNWTIVDINAPNEEGIVSIKKLFDENYSEDIKYETIVHSHLIEHVYDINIFLKKVSSILKPNGTMIFSVPNMMEMISRKFANCINFEHTVLLTEYFLEKFLCKHGFDVIRKQYFKEDHSIFYHTVYLGQIENLKLDVGSYETYKNMFLDYITFHKNLVQRYNNIIHTVNNDVYLFGAHVVSQYLLSYGLDDSRIKMILDNDKNKHNTRLCGTRLNVSMPYEEIHDKKSPIIILRCGTFSNEIKSDILTNINSSTIFLE